MTALSINVSTQDPETCGHGLPSGLSNLRGQQVSNQRILARENRDAAFREYDKAISAYERQEIDIEALLALKKIYDLAEAWYVYILASESYALSVSMLINGEIDCETQAGIYNNMITAGTTFRSM